MSEGAGAAHTCKPGRGGMWYTDAWWGGGRICRTCGQFERCLRDGHVWVQSTVVIGILWRERCHVTDGMGLTAPGRPA